MSDIPDLNGPAAAPPPGVTQNLINPPNENDVVIGVISFFILLAGVFSLIHVYAKVFFLKKIRFEDYLIIPIIGTYIGFCIFWLRISLTPGIGHFVHIWDFRIKNLAPFYHDVFLSVQLYGATMLVLKPAILLEWCHIFAATNPRGYFFWTCVVVSVLNVLNYLLGIVIESTSCTPQAAWWDKTIPGHCLDTQILALTTAIVNLVLDVVILILPQRTIWKLQMSWQKRLSVSIVFIVGALATASAAARLATSQIYVESPDLTYNTSQTGLWLAAEMTAGIIIFATPATPKPMAHLMQQAGASVSMLLGSKSRDADTGTTGSWMTPRKRSHPSYEDIDGSARQLSTNKSKQSLNSKQVDERVSESEVALHPGSRFNEKQQDTQDTLQV
ncbi:hypothetical protein F5Y03DRAFT_370473 [Xylaria venustula]|nr:hypothetical protein F5Y03DRAFT_370473 [Xylaria venustula]